ncbi:MAG: RQC domain-containing protein, partial [Cyanobacteria bacterium P01_F01_bin.4]
ARCRERFGMTHIIDVLRGSRKKRIVELGHDQLSTYGIGKDRSIDEWRALCRSLLHQELLEETTDGYSVLKLNAGSWQVLKKQTPVHIHISQQPTTEPKTSKDIQLTPDETLLLGQLRALRKQLADEQFVPPYIVFSDASLRQMAQQRPVSLSTFAQISGVGKRKLEQYGETFTSEIAKFCQAHNLESDSSADETLPPPSASSNDLADTHLTTYKLYQQGLSASEIAIERGLRLSTIINHFASLIEHGQEIDLDQLVSPERQVPIFAAIEKVGHHSLRTIRDELGETFDYNEISLVRAAWENQQ